MILILHPDDYSNRIRAGNVADRHFGNVKQRHVIMRSESRDAILNEPKTSCPGAKRGAGSSSLSNFGETAFAAGGIKGEFIILRG